MNYSKGVICTADHRQSIEDFASELLELRKKGTGVLVGVFNVFIFKDLK